MEDELAPKWFEAVFLNHIDAIRPQVLILDQHHSHEAYEILHLAREHRVTVFALPPHTTHWLQPLDKGCFSSLASRYHAAASDFMCAEKANIVTKATFLKLFSDAWRHGMIEENVLSAFRFRCTGISPFNPSIIPPRAFTHVDPQEARSVQVTPTMDLSHESDAPGGFYLGQRLLTPGGGSLIRT